jgi:hypothetical protein
MKRLVICTAIATVLAAPVALSQNSTNFLAAGGGSNAPPISVQVVIPGAVSVTNVLTVKADEQIQRLLQEVGVRSTPVTVHLDSQSATQLLQLTASPIPIGLDDKGMALLHEATADKWFKKELFISSLLGAALAIFAGWLLHRIEIGHRRREEREFTRKVLKAIEAELDALFDIFNQGIGGKLKEKTGRMFLWRLALSQDYFTVFATNAVHLGKVDPEIAKTIITHYQSLKELIENFRINNEYVQLYDAVVYQLSTTSPTRPDGVVRKAVDLEGFLNDQGDHLIKLSEKAGRQYRALKEMLNAASNQQQP